jgi:hypothetical protein
VWTLALLAAGLLVGWLVIESNWAREKARTVLVREASEALGREVSIASLDFELVPPSAEVRELVVGGPDGLDEPLATLDSARVVLDTGILAAIFGDEPIEIAEIDVVEPHIRLLFYEDGTSNLPDLPEREPTDEPARGIRIDSLHLRQGQLNLDQLEVPLELAAADVRIVLSAVPGSDEDLAGRFESSRVDLQLPESESLGASVTLDLLATDGGLDIERARIEGPNLTASIGGGYRDDQLDLQVTAESGGRFLEAMGWGDQVEGDFSIEAVVQATTGDPTTGADGGEWTVSASFTAPHLLLAEQPVSGIEATADVTAAGIEARITRATFVDGALAGTLTMPLGVEEPEISLEITLTDADLANLLETEEAPFAGLAASLDAEASYVFTAAAPTQGEGTAWVDLSVPETVVGLPIQGEFPLQVSGGMLRFDSGRLSAPGQLIEASGVIDLEQLSGDLDLVFDTTDPRALLRLIPAIYEDDESPLWEPSRGQGRIQGTASFDSDGFRSDLEIDLTSAIISGSRLASAEGTVALDSGGIQDLRFELERGVSTLDLQASFPFADETPGFETPPFLVGLEIDSWPLAEAAPWLPFEIPFNGTVSGNLDMSGSPDAPEGLLNVTLTDIEASGLEVEGTLAGEIRFDPQQVAVGPVRLTAPSGELELSGTFDPESEALDLRLTSSLLDLTAAPFSDLSEGYLAGVAELSAQVGGTLSDPQLSMELNGSGLAMVGGVLGSAGASSLDLSLADEQLSIEGSLLGLVELSGGGRLAMEGETLVTDLAIAVESDHLAEFVEIGVGQAHDDLNGRFSGVVAIEGGEEFTATLRLDEFDISHIGTRLGVAEPIEVTFSEGVFRVGSFFLIEESSRSELVVAGVLMDAEGEIGLWIDANIDASWATLYEPDFDISGEMRLLASIRGTPADPVIDGQAEIIDGRFIIPDFPHALESIQGFLYLYADPGRVVLDAGSAMMAGGKVGLQGEFAVDLDDAWSYELRFQARDLDLRYPEDWQIRGDADLTLSSRDQGRMLSGSVALERAAFVKNFRFGIAELLRTMFGHSAELVDETDPVLVDTRLNIAVLGPDALNVQTNLVTLRGSLDLTVHGNLAAPVLLGDVTLARGGRLDLGGGRYEIERGSFTFANPFRNDPHIDLLATTRIKQYDVRLNLFGPVDDLQTSVSSSPPLGDLDVLSLMTTGSADTMSSFGSTTPGSETGGQASAEAFLAGQAASLAGRRVGSMLGLDTVQISPLTGASSDLSAARVTLGMRISRDVYVTYSHDPSASDEAIYEIRWQVSPSVSVVLTRSGRGSFSTDLLWDTSF